MYYAHIREDGAKQPVAAHLDGTAERAAEFAAAFGEAAADAAGKRRLRQIAKKCVDYGQRVQNSVFECLLDAAQCRSLQAKLLAIMDAEKDSLRFYYLGNAYEKKVEHFGCKTTYRPEGPLIL